MAYDRVGGVFLKKNCCTRKIIWLLLVIGMVFSLGGCYHAREKAYYSDKNNFLSGEAVVDNIIFDEKNDCLYFWLSDLDDVYQDYTFKVAGKNVDILLESSLFEKVQIGSKITFSSAPRYFGDGYCMPIVALSCDGEVLLPFEVGHENLMRLY